LGQDEVDGQLTGAGTEWRARRRRRSADGEAGAILAAGRDAGREQRDAWPATVYAML
jgi:hypothetical protein